MDSGFYIADDYDGRRCVTYAVHVRAAPNRNKLEGMQIDRRAIQNLVDRIARAFRPERVILFGSRAYGEPRPDSDVDLLVIMPFEGTPYRMAVEILQRVQPEFSVDVLPRRPDDTKNRYRLGDPLIREALDRGEVLFEAQ